MQSCRQSLVQSLCCAYILVAKPTLSAPLPLDLDRNRLKTGSHVRELIPLRALDDIVQNQHCAVVTALKDQDILIFGLLMMKDLVDLEGHGLAWPQVGLFREPSI